MEARLLDRADRRNVLDRGFRKDPLDAELARRPVRSKSKGTRTDPPPTRIREHRNSQASDFLVVELDVD